ncbi:MAG: aldehyde dehydrogenase family protein [Pseudonocardiaceae bacterium]|nr:aldehyde dehydrogenase family protein [Pseudonocardiaceae bacterium]
MSAPIRCAPTCSPRPCGWNPAPSWCRKARGSGSSSTARSPATTRPTWRNAPIMTSDSTNPIADVVTHLDGVAPSAIVAGLPRAGERHDLPDPSTGNTFADVAWGDVDDVHDAVRAAVAVAPEWAATSARERAAALRAIAAELRENSAALADVIMMETGKRYAEAEGEVGFSAQYFEWFADAATMPTDQHLRTGARRFLVSHQPVGVVAAVSPWNFPLSIPARKVAPALAAGSPVVLKPSELTPLSGLGLTQLAGRHLPGGSLNVVVGDGEKITTALVDQDSVAAVSFTGSTRVGTLVAQRAMGSMTRVTMELGGKAPFVICADADLDVAVEALLVAKFRNNGASCIAANNVFVHRGVYDSVLRSLADRIPALRVGDPRDPATELGPLLRQSHVARLTDLVRRAEADGCRVRAGNVPEQGWYCPPTLVEAENDTALWGEEVFGPVCVVRPYDDEDALVREVNGWRCGLGGYVMSASAEHAVELAARLRIGIVGVNNGAPNTPEVPFGGFGFAGFGREGGLTGLHEFTEQQSIALAR